MGMVGRGKPASACKDTLEIGLLTSPLHNTPLTEEPI